jgi:long-subunit fatty acid transport protein
MRASLTLIVMTAWIAAPLAWSQTAAPQPAATQQAAAQAGVIQRNAGDANASQPSPAAPAAAADGQTSVTHASRRSTARHSHSQSAAGTAPGGAPPSKSDSVLSLGATDITGNKELPKVMVIVPWKDSMGAGGVIKPTDSLMDEVLQPVDRGVFQRRIRYYGDLNAAGESPAAGKAVAPVGDSHRR